MSGYTGAMRRYASFSGRASRAEFWWYTVVLIVIFIAVIVLETSMHPGPADQERPLTGLFVLIHLLPSLAVSVRRLHDTDRSGWLLLIGVVPLIGTIVQIVWACQQGTPGANRFGPDPLSIQAGPVGRELPTPMSPSPRDVIAEIERLAQLRANGSLTEIEFEVMKAQALGHGGRA